MKCCWIAGWVLCLSLATSYSADNLWSGAVSSNWNDGANWSLGGVPDAAFGDNAVISTNSPNIATITADISSTPNDINVTGGGRIDHQAGIAGTFGGAWMYVGMDSTPSFYNLADTSTTRLGISGYGQGTGTLNVTGNLNLAAWGGSRNGTMNINTTGALNVTGTLRIGNDGGSVGLMNLESGAVILSHANTVWGHDETHIGHGGGIATLNIAGGSLSASRNFRLGNDRGNGTINITGGSLTVAGTNDVFIGRDRGTAVVNQSGGVVDFNHNTFIANGNNQSDPTRGTYNLSAGVLNVKREFVIGREGASATGTLNMTGGTITKTGDEKFLVGHNNATGTLVQSGGTITVNNELYIGNENAGASGTYTLSGTGALTISNEVVVGRESGTGVLNVNGGTFNTAGNGNMYIGRRNGTGTLNQTDGTISVNREFGVGTRDDNKIGIGTYNLSGGTLSVSNNIFVGKEQGASGTMTMTGGTMTGSDKLIIGDNGATGAIAHSDGTVTVQNEVYVGNGLSQAPAAVSILASDADGQLEKRSEWAPGTVTIQNTVDWQVGVGEWYGSGLTTAVIPFRLPNFGAVANPFTSASFGVNLIQVGSSTVTDLDLYAVRVSDTPQIATTDWYNGSEPDPNATLIQASFLTPTSTTTSVGAQSGPNNLTDAAGSAALLAYLNSAYNGGAGAGRFVFLRVSYGSDNFPTGWDAYKFTTRNAALEGDAPVINFTSSTPVVTGEGTYTLSGSAELNVGNEVQIGRENGTGTVNLNGGTVNAKKISGGTGSATVNFNGGLLKAKVDESNLIQNLDVANVQSGGLRIDSNGFNVSTSQALTGTGGLEKLGAGQLTLSGSTTYLGTTTVAAGILRIEKTGLNAIINADANTLVAEFTSTPAPGSYRILSGSLAGAQTFSATGLGSNRQATFSSSSGIVTVTEVVSGPSFSTAYPGKNPTDIAPNGLTYLVNYAFGGDENTPATLPLQDFGEPTKLRLSVVVRTDDNTVTLGGESSTDLIGGWSASGITITDAPSTDLPANLSRKVISVDRGTDPKKFLRATVTQ